MKKKILRIIMILMLVLMGSAQAMAQGDKLKKVSYAKSGETLKGEQLYSRNRAGYISEQADGYAIYPWIIYLENGGTVQLELPDGQKHQVGLGKHSFTYHHGEKMYIDVRVVSYAVPYLGGLRLQGAVSGRDNVRLEKTVSEEDFFTYTITSDADLMKTIKINPQGGYDIDGNLGIHAALTQKFPERNYEYALRLPVEQERSFAAGVSVSSLKDMAVQQGLNPNDFVLQIGLDDGEVGSVFSEVYLNQARYQRKTTFLRILDKRQKYYTLKASSNDEALGTVEPATLTVKAGGEATFTAKAKENAIFKGWKEKGTGEERGTPVLYLTDIQKASEWTAVFEKKAEEKYYTLKASSNDEALGSVNPATLTVKAGGEASFTATAKENAIFKGWKEKGTGEERDTPVLHLTNIQGSSEWVAVFETKPEEKRTLTVKVEPEQVGKVLLNGENQSSITVKRGTSVRLKAEVVDQNYEFRSWKTDGQVSLGKQNPFDYPVAETETVIAVFEKKASAPQVGPVEINFGQREALLTWAAGSATSWIVKVYQGEQVVFDQEIQTPQLMLVGLKPGENYRYEIVAKMSGKLPSQAVQGSFRTDQFDVDDSLTPHLKNFSKLERNKSFPIIFLDVDPKDFSQGMSVEAYSQDAQEVKSSLTLRKDGNIQWLTLPEGNAKTLLFVLKSGSEIRYELTYDLSK
ncbi:InlB B-repeat-containing protein [Candidatus Gracilibacteria bacterium]|nr:InlB B-repeat-containing protein [Candidatus Gracilibacteria bacterium]